MIDNNKYNINVLGEPRGKGRPRTCQRGKRVTIYTDSKTKLYEKEVAKACNYAISNNNVQTYFNNEPLSVNIKAFSTIPKSYTKKRVQAIYNGLEFPTKKPDIDNIIKIILDGMNKVMYADDKQIIYTSAYKLYALDGLPRVEIRVSEFNQFELF